MRIDESRSPDVLLVAVKVVVEPDGNDRDAVLLGEVFDDSLGPGVQFGGDDGETVRLVDVLGDARFTLWPR